MSERETVSAPGTPYGRLDQAESIRVGAVQTGQTLLADVKIRGRVWLDGPVPQLEATGLDTPSDDVADKSTQIVVRDVHGLRARRHRQCQ